MDEVLPSIAAGACPLVFPPHDVELTAPCQQVTRSATGKVSYRGRASLRPLRHTPRHTRADVVCVAQERQALFYVA
eukprot:27984-Eustigmatos_ZCMA.PRE.1